jgi:hypothetical protein
MGEKSENQAKWADQIIVNLTFLGQRNLYSVFVSNGMLRLPGEAKVEMF